MNRFDEGGFARTMACLEAERTHPKRDDGAIIAFSEGEAPLVRVEEIYGRAISYLRTYGLVARINEQRGYQVSWFPGNQIKREDEGAWRGRPI